MLWAEQTARHSEAIRLLVLDLRQRPQPLDTRRPLSKDAVWWLRPAPWAQPAVPLQVLQP